MKHSLRVVLAIALLSGLAPRVADCASNWGPLTPAAVFIQGFLGNPALFAPPTVGDLADKFDEWAKSEWADQGWKSGLPKCPCKNPTTFVFPFVLDPDIDLEKFHPGASQCNRSLPLLIGPGQQCCYDNHGKLLTFGPGAGTPDRVAPLGTPNYEAFLLSIKLHTAMDVEPFKWAAAKVLALQQPALRVYSWRFFKDIDVSAQAWVVYNALRDDPQECPTNPSNPILMDLGGRQLSFDGSPGHRFLTPQDTR